MYLKNLTVLGFKSFADKTALNFQPGVTAIVGPNGCGKSNVSDAIRWVLGEQSAKALRGGEMADVIFNGTDARKPLSMAEVSLTIGGVDQEQLKSAGVEIHYDEVTVTRRVFRDGGSEYFLNKTSCRLRDIQQLFLGTGVGRTSYSIMAQGNITQILSSKPEDRRLIFEEAAGITKFKAQKKEALRKLDQTDQNLLRVQDLIKEVKRQIGSLQRQAGKARRYKQLMMELQHLDTQLARHQFDVLQSEIEERNRKTEGLRQEIESSSEEVLRCEDEILQLRSRLSELEQAISLTQQRGIELKGLVDRNEGRIQFNDQRLQELQSQHGKTLDEIAQAEERIRVSEAELAMVTRNLEDGLAALEGHRQHLEERRAAVSQVEQELMSRQDTLRQTQSQTFAAAQQLSRLRNEINALDLVKQGNVVRLEKLSAEKVQLEEERVRLDARLSEFNLNVETHRVNVLASRGTVSERQERLRELQQEIAQVTQELDAVLRRQAETRSKLTVLEQLEADHEGFSGGSLAALKQTHLVLGSLADHIRVAPENVIPIETALGHHLQLVLTEMPNTARQILSDLASQKQGRASLAALNLLPADPNGAGADAAVVDSIVPGTPAAQLVEADPAVQRLIQRLLGSTVVVDDLSAATEAWSLFPGRYDFVTRDGQMLSRHGVYTGGGAQGTGKAPASILGRKNQIAELQTQLAAIQEESHELSRSKGAKQSEQTALQASLQEAQSTLREQEVAIATHQGELNALQGSVRLLQQKIETVIYEIQTLSAHDEEGAGRRNGLVSRASELELQEQQGQEQIAMLTSQVEELRQTREAANTALTEIKVALAADEQLCASFRQQKQPLERRIGELQQLIDVRQREIGGFGDRKQQYETEIEEARRQIIDLQREREEVNVRATELLSEKQVQEQGVNSREEELRNRRRHLHDIQQQRGQLEVELAQKSMSVQNLRERIQQKYNLNLDEIRSECIKVTIADEGPARIETLTPDEMAAAGGTDWEVVASQVSALQKRVDEIGPVNLVAIEEYEETEQRHQFLTQQNDDLTKAKEQLLEVLSRINVQTREMFIATFNQIRDNFRAMFVEVFGGGKADLILVDENNVLESGIDIVARPPGKQLQSISLLSGGEQTMTAVSLMFSIYQVKPSPFCILDELDAPLDESNVNRFVKVLRRFLEHSQFIIITHNKRTISMADVLYGVTMQERGVSRIVSVKLNKEDTTTGDTVGGKALVPVTDPGAKKEESMEVAMAK